MSPFGSWFRPSKEAPKAADASTAKPVPPAPSPEELLAAEMANMEHAFSTVELIINDDMDGAEAALKAGNSSCYHQLALAVISFIRSVLGAEKDVMAVASAQLADCEARAQADQKRAQLEFTARAGAGAGTGGETGDSVYPAGSEYALVHAEAMLMSAVVGMLHESLTEGIKSFYKLRKAYLALEALINLEVKGVKSTGEEVTGAAPTPRRKSLAECFAEDQMPGTFSAEEFADDLAEALPEVAPSTNTETGANPKPAESKEPAPSSDSSKATSLAQGDISTPATSTLTKTSLDTKSPFTSPRDVFIHSGVMTCFGALLFLFSTVPPALSRLLGVIGFRGDRARGVRMLWESAAFPNVHGAIAAVVLLSYYNGLLGLSDILPPQSEFDEDAEVVGLPVKKCEALLEGMRARYPRSGFWQIEQSRMRANARDLAGALNCLTEMPKSNMQQVDALAVFETATDAMFAMDWVLMRDSFLRCLELNAWSKSLYYFMAGCAEVERYRDAVHGVDSVDAEEIKKRKESAERFFKTAPGAAGKKRFLAKQLPFEAFALRKIQKWEARAKEHKIDLADAVGVSAAQEMSYLWNGGKRVDAAQASKALGYLKWERCTAPKEAVEKIKGEVDEASIQGLCESALLRALGQVKEARSVLEARVLANDRSHFRGSTKDDYVLPCANYEMAVLAWTEACPAAGAECASPPSQPIEDGTDGEREAGDDRREETGGEKPQPEPETEAEKTEGGETETPEDPRKAKIDECQTYLDKAANWEAFILDARCGMRVQTGMETVKWYKKKMGW